MDGPESVSICIDCDIHQPERERRGGRDGEGTVICGFDDLPGIFSNKSCNNSQRQN